MTPLKPNADKTFKELLVITSKTSKITIISANLKRVLIISPNFPPVNAADMHRVRQCLPFLNGLGWIAEVVVVDIECIESYSIDSLLTDTVPDNVKVHSVEAWDVDITRKFGLGSLSMRSYFSIS